MTVTSKAATYHGRPCPKGHTLRLRSTRACVQCNREQNKRYRAVTGTLDVIEAPDQIAGLTPEGQLARIMKADAREWRRRHRMLDEEAA